MNCLMSQLDFLTEGLGFSIEQCHSTCHRQKAFKRAVDVSSLRVLIIQTSAFHLSYNQFYIVEGCELREDVGGS